VRETPWFLLHGFTTQVIFTSRVYYKNDLYCTVYYTGVGSDRARDTIICSPGVSVAGSDLLRVCGLGFWVYGLGFGVYGLGFGV